MPGPSPAQASGELAYKAVRKGGPSFEHVVLAFEKYLRGARPGDAGWTSDDSRVLSWVLSRPLETIRSQPTMDLEKMMRDADPTRRG